MAYPFNHNERYDLNEGLNIESLDYHGISAGFIDKSKIVERIDARLPISKANGAILIHGQGVKAMIINGLGFTQSAIYLSHHFFENKALSVCFEKAFTMSVSLTMRLPEHWMLFMHTVSPSYA